MLITQVQVRKIILLIMAESINSGICQGYDDFECKTIDFEGKMTSSSAQLIIQRLEKYHTYIAILSMTAKSKSCGSKKNQGEVFKRGKRPLKKSETT